MLRYRISFFELLNRAVMYRKGLFLKILLIWEFAISVIIASDEFRKQDKKFQNVSIPKFSSYQGLEDQHPIILKNRNERLYNFTDRIQMQLVQIIRHTPPPQMLTRRLMSSLPTTVPQAGKELWLPWEHMMAVRNSTIVLWPETSPGVYEIPYEISDKLFSAWTIENIIIWSMRNIERGSNIRFRPMLNRDENWIRFESGKLCLSRIGRLPEKGSQRIVLNPTTCMFRHAIQHEILHALGFFHEHQRIDNHHFLSVEPGAPIDILPQLVVDDRVPVADKPYDMASLMHYHIFLRATDPKNQKIIETRSATLSSCDWNLLNTLYPGEVQPPPCFPHQHIISCEPVSTCPFSKNECLELCKYDCDFGLSRGDIQDVNPRIPVKPYCRYISGLPFPPLPSLASGWHPRLSSAALNHTAVESQPIHRPTIHRPPTDSIEPEQSVYQLVDTFLIDV